MMDASPQTEEIPMIRSLNAYAYGLYPYGFTGCLRCGG